jgi:APA family basic amino acid/polyamine antiporter
LFVGLLARPARVFDASAEAQDPEISRLRGRTPLVLVPITNPGNAEAMIAVANALTPPEVGRVLLLSVAVFPGDGKGDDRFLTVRHAQAVLGDTLIASAKAGLFPEALATVALNPWEEISRIVAEHRCESLLLGLTELKGDVNKWPLNDLLSTVSCEVLVLRAPPGWRLSDVREILVPVGGHQWHDRLRARLLGSLFRTGDRRVTFLRVVPESAPPPTCTRARRELARTARDEAPGRSQVKVVAQNDVARVIIEHAAESHLVILGVERRSPRHAGFGPLTLRIARESESPILIISHRRR